MKKGVLPEQSLGPGQSVEKVDPPGLFSKAQLGSALGMVRVRVRVSFSKYQKVHFRRTRWGPRLGT